MRVTSETKNVQSSAADSIRQNGKIVNTKSALAEATKGKTNGEIMRQVFSAGQNVERYVSAWDMAETLGRETELTLEQARTHGAVSELTDTQLDLAMTLGRAAAKQRAQSIQAREAQFAEARGKAAELNKQGVVQRKAGTVSFEDVTIDGVKYKGADRSKLTRKQKNIVAMVEQLADVVNLDYSIIDGDSTVGGAYSKGGHVMINIRSGEFSGRTLAAATLSHELTHHLQDYSPDAYETYKQFIIDAVMKQSSEGFEELVQKQLDIEPELSYAEAVDEVIANASQTMLRDSKAVRQLARQNMTLFEKIADYVAELSEKISRAFADVDPNADMEVFEATRAIRDAFKEAQELWDNALLAANENYNAEQATGKKISADEGGRTKYMITGITGQSGKYYGVGVVLDSTLLDGLTETERVEMVAAYIDSAQGQTFPAYDANGNQEDIKVAKKTDKFRRSDGKRVEVNHDLTHKYNKSIVKQESVVLLDELLAASRKDSPRSPLHSHEWLDNNGLTPWDMRKVYVQDKSGAVWEAVLQIANADTGEKIIYDIHPINKMEGPRKSGTSSKKSKTQKDSSVKKQNQIFSSEYNEAVENNDMDTAARLVEQAADAAGYKYRGYHGTLATDFTEFKKEYIGTRYSFDEKGFFFIDRESIAKDYATSEFDGGKKGRVIDAYLRIKRPFVVDKAFALKDGMGNIYRDNDVIDVWDSYSSYFLEVAEERKADGIILDDGNTKMYVVFDGEQIKSAEPVTYDDDGNVIPLEERFKSKKTDFRFQKWGIGETAEERQARKDSVSKLKAENDILRARAEYWKAQTKPTKERSVRQQDTDRLANDLLREYESRADKDGIKTALKDLGDWMVQSDGESLSYDELYDRAQSIAEEISTQTIRSSTTATPRALIG